MGSNESLLYESQDIENRLETNTDGMVKLNFEFERIKQIPECVFESPVLQKQLQVLNLIGNKITILPSSIQNLKHLTYISLTSNKLTVLPPQLANCNQLEVLMVYDNKLTSLPETFSKLSRLRKVDLHSNRFRNFPKVLASIKAIQWLSLSNNPMSHLPQELGNLYNLKNLYINNMKLECLPDSFCKLLNLETLNLKNNKLAVLPQNFYKLSKLRDEHYGEGLNLSDNPLKIPPIEICTQGPSSVAAYLQEMDYGVPVTNRHLGLILTGESGAGKTSLANALIEGKSNLTSLDDRTVVVNRLNWVVRDEENLQFQVTDLGAQEHYRNNTYHAFLHSDAIFIQVFDLKNTHPSLNFDQWMGSWLDMLNARTPGAVVLIVGTHKDLIRSEGEVHDKVKQIEDKITAHGRKQTADLKATLASLEQALDDPNGISPSSQYYGLTKSALEGRMASIENQLNKRVRVILPMHVVSSAEGLEGVEELRDHIMELAKTHFSPKVIPQSWYELKNAIQASSKPKFHYLRYDYIADTIGQSLGLINPNRLDPALKFLHISGYILWYNSIPELSGLVFHRPEKLVGLLQCIFRHDIEDFLRFDNDLIRTIGGFSKPSFERAKEHFLKGGLLCDELLQVLWNDLDLDWRTFKTFKHLLLTFDWCFKVPASDVAPGLNPQAGLLLFPSYLSQSFPAELSYNTWPPECPIDRTQFTAEFHFPNHCPEGYLEKAMVRLNRFVSWRKDWKDGVCAISNLNQILLEKRREYGVWLVTLTVRGPQVDSLWTDFLPIYRDMKQLLLQWPGVRYDIQLLCPHCITTRVEAPRRFCGEMLEFVAPEGTSHLVCSDSIGKEIQVDVRFLYPPQHVFDTHR